MRAVADAHALPLAPATVDLVVGNPPYPGNGVWEDDYWAGLDAAIGECRRVLRPGGRGWLLLGKRGVSERWLTFDHTNQWWAHEGSSAFPAVPRPHITNWGVVPDADVFPLVLAHSRPGDVVLDPFAGRGGIPRLAARLGRVPIGADIDLAQLENGGPY
jgi:DNA modification methylase